MPAVVPSEGTTMKKLLLPATLLVICAAFMLLALNKQSSDIGPVRIAIIDTGIATAAIDPTFIEEGYNYILPDEGTEDKLGHGTAIAGILVGSQPAGIIGICPEAVLIPLVYETAGPAGDRLKTDLSVVAQAIYDAVDVYDCDIINLSAGVKTDTEELRKAAAYAESQEVLVVSSAGNDRNSTVYYPGGYEIVLCVGACNREETGKASFSNFHSSVDLLAEGDGIRVASIRGKTIRVFGTSYATAYATGTAANLLSEHPKLTPAQVRQILRESARDVYDAGYDISSGWGILDRDAALQWAARRKMPLRQS